MNNHQSKGDTPANLRALTLIRRAFAASRMTQADLAKASGIPRSTIANILSETAGPRLVNIDWFVRIAVALDADLVAWMSDLEEVGPARRDTSGRDPDSRLKVVHSERRGLPEGSDTPLDDAPRG